MVSITLGHHFIIVSQGKYHFKGVQKFSDPLIEISDDVLATMQDASPKLEKTKDEMRRISIRFQYKLDSLCLCQNRPFL